MWKRRIERKREEEVGDQPKTKVTRTLAFAGGARPEPAASSQQPAASLQHSHSPSWFVRSISSSTFDHTFILILSYHAMSIDMDMDMDTDMGLRMGMNRLDHLLIPKLPFGAQPPRL